VNDRIKNIHNTALTEHVNDRGERWSDLDLSGEHLGVRIEDLAPGASSSVHHFHSLEEEHVLVLRGTATLIVGSEEIVVREGDHFWFPAGRPEGHHLVNRGTDRFRFLVVGERAKGDVVFYPEHEVMLVKALGNAQFTYRERKPERPE
jgi:uncharacterized cupin superfamily protein